MNFGEFIHEGSWEGSPGSAFQPKYPTPDQSKKRRPFQDSPSDYEQQRKDWEAVEEPPDPDTKGTFAKVHGAQAPHYKKANVATKTDIPDQFRKTIDSFLSKIINTGQAKRVINQFGRHTNPVTVTGRIHNKATGNVHSMYSRQSGTHYPTMDRPYPKQPAAQAVELQTHLNDWMPPVTKAPEAPEEKNPDIRKGGDQFKDYMSDDPWDGSPAGA